MNASFPITGRNKTAFLLRALSMIEPALINENNSQNNKQTTKMIT